MATRLPSPSRTPRWNVPGRSSSANVSDAARCVVAQHREPQVDAFPRPSSLDNGELSHRRPRSKPRHLRADLYIASTMRWAFTASAKSGVAAVPASDGRG